jgi:hypothetical protein
LRCSDHAVAALAEAATSEGMLEAVSTNEFAFRVVGKLKYGSYCECDIEDGVLYLQCTPATFGTNIDLVASKLMDRL